MLAFGREITLCIARSRDQKLPTTFTPILAGVGPTLFTSVPGSGLN